MLPVLILVRILSTFLTFLINNYGENFEYIFNDHFFFVFEAACVAAAASRALVRSNIKGWESLLSLPKI